MSLSATLQINKTHAAQSASGVIPVAVLLGGTAGIGASIARRLVEAHGGRIRLILSSRSRSSGEEVIASLPSPPAVKHKPQAEWVGCDATSLSAIRELAQTIRGTTDKVNYVVLTCGQLTTAGSDRTADGIEKKLAMNYYSRFSLTSHLLPLLRAAREAGEPARVLSVLAPGRGGEIDLDDLGLAHEAQRSGKGGALQRSRWLRAQEKAGVVYNDFAIEYLAAQNPTLSFIHAFPGFVKTSALNSMPLAVRLASAPFAWLATPSDTSGAYMASLLLNPALATGAHCAGPKAEPLASTTWPGLDATKRKAALEKVWTHTKEVGKLDE